MSDDISCRRCGAECVSWSTRAVAGGLCGPCYRYTEWAYGARGSWEKAEAQ